MSRISIIVPVYNCEGTIIKCLSSIVNQDWPEVETIIIDDGSSDNSLAICREYSAAHSNITILEERHSGVSKSRNIGLKVATGEYVTFCDADDELLPTALSSMASRFNDSIDLVVGNVNKKDSPVFDEDIRLSQDEAITRFFRHDGKRLLGCVYGKLYRRSIIQPVDGNCLTFNESISVGEDALFLLYYLLRCRTVQVCHTFVYMHRNNANGIISSSQLSEYLSALDASKMMMEAVSSNRDLYNLAVEDLCWVFRLIQKRFAVSSNTGPAKERFKSIIESVPHCLQKQNWVAD